MHDDLSVIFIGLGEEYANQKMEDSIGERLFAHSEFFQILQQEGLIGLTLLLSILFSLRFFIYQHKNSIYYSTAFAIFIGIVVEMTFQGGFYFNVVFLFSIYLALLKQEEKRIRI
jgi:Ni,Fe-hydrogenase I cytochrome b subunit